jgi:DNA-binding transcriptional LysR family regulator
LAFDEVRRSGVDVMQMRAFLAVAEELHFGRAAERLHVAQPPLSRTIQQLEKELGSRLFDRSTRTVRLTAAGQALVAPARNVVESLRRAEASVRAADTGHVGLVRIAFAGVSTYPLVARLARAVRSNKPGIQLELSSQNFAQPAMKKLVRGDTDLALGRWDFMPAEVSTQVVMPDSLVIAMPDTHTLAGARSISIASLAEQPFISLPPYEGSVLPDRLRRLAQASGFVADVVQVAPDTQAALALVGAEVGCHLTLISVARNVADPHVVFVPLDESAPDVDLRAAWRTGDRGSAVRAVLEELFAISSSAAA